MGLTFIDFFAGIGGFRRGMEMAGHRCVGFCEYDKFAVAGYTIMHLATEEQRKYIGAIPAPPKKNGGRNLNARQKEIAKEEYKNGEWYAKDVRAVDAATIPRADCWCFGFPCVDISVAGKCIGFKGHRSSLFFAVTRLIRELPEESRPNRLFIENVKNLLSVNRGLDFARVLVELDEIGYDAEWEVLNSKDYCVPHNRERIFIVGHLRGRSTRKVFPIGRAASENHVEQIGNLVKTGNWKNSQRGRYYSTSGISPALNCCGGGGLVPKVSVPGIQVVAQNKLEYQIGFGQRDKVYGIEGIMACLTAGDYRQPKRIAIPVLTPDRVNKRQNGRRFKEDGDPMFTLTGQDRHGICIREATKQGYAVAQEGDSINLTMPDSKTRRGRIGKGAANTKVSADTMDTSCNQGTLDGMRIRKLTPRECFRLQGWEDIFYDRAELVNSDSQLYKQTGNQVTVTVIAAIGSQME